MILSKGESYFMDIVRFLSALLVMITHACAIWFPAYSVHFYHYGHAAVVVFFVLSGYVIAYSVKSKNTGAVKFAAARLNRLYSVLIPALVITAVIEIIIKFTNPAAYEFIHRGGSLLRYITCLFFCNEVWFMSAAPPVNAPLWSLSFEFFYYLIYGLFFFRRKSKVLYGLLFLALLVCGPKIIAMFPIWLSGVAIAYLPKPKLAVLPSYLLVVVFLAIALGVVIYIPELPYTLGTAPWFFAAGFASDFVIGIFIALVFLFFPRKAPPAKKHPDKRYNTIRKIADLTFPLYVLHNPFLVLTGSIITVHQNSFMQLALVLTVVFFVCMLLGTWMGNYKQFWSNLFLKIMNRLKEILINDNRMIVPSENKKSNG